MSNTQTQEEVQQIKNDFLDLVEKEGYDREAGEAYLEFVYSGDQDEYQLLSGFEDSYSGKFDSWEEFAEDLLEACGDLANLPALIRSHIDWKGIGSELSYDYYEQDGYFFRNC